ncbi:MAG: hypothetical protein JSR34_06050 [Proteobacteria bacterium]|nr:hypothetical protein [Pseudomonadota bacterium]
MAAKWLALARKLFIPIALGFLAYSAWRASGRLAPLLATLSIRYLLLAWACWIAAQWIGPLTTVAFARILGLSLGYRELSLITVLRLPAKYLPGGIWQSVARFEAYRRLEVGKSDSLSILVAEHLLALGVSVAIGAALLLRLEGIEFLRGAAAWALGGAAMLLAGTVLGLLKARGGGIKTFVEIVMAIFSTALFWVAATASFCAYWAAAFDLGGAEVMRVAACYLLSWAAGFVVLFAPQGLGVFEWVAGHLMASAWPLSVTVTAVAGFRLVTIFADFSAWAIGLALSGILRRAPR